MPPPDFALVDSLQDIRQTLGNFTANAPTDLERTRKLITQTRFWVFDPASGSFGPSKFVGLRDMTFEKYRAAGDVFDGNQTRTRIERVLSAAYAEDRELAARLRSWAQSLFPGETNLLAGVDQSKWLFVTLPAIKQTDWSDDEVAAIVADYMAMLHAELAGESYSKTGHRNALLKRLPLRNRHAVEFKHANISAVLHGMGLAYIDGYKPRGNIQEALKIAVQDYLADRPDLVNALGGELETPLTSPPDGFAVRIEDIEVPPPESQPTPAVDRKPPRRATKIDWAVVDALNRKLGSQGERFVHDMEVEHLKQIGRPDLASKVEWTAVTQGDGLGYDIRSFDDRGTEKFIEVKTTRGPKSMPFLITANELAFAEEARNRYWIYRLFRFGLDTKFYRIGTPLEDRLMLKPRVLIATPR